VPPVLLSVFAGVVQSFHQDNSPPACRQGGTVGTRILLADELEESNFSEREMVGESSLCQM
jgi:hypothetical protein